jgi:hypothetical protein
LKPNLKIFFLFFFVQLVFYFIFTINMRAIAQANYGATIVSDLLIAAITFKVIKKIGEATTNWAYAGYVAGGAFGSVIAIYLTKLIWGT